VSEIPLDGVTNAASPVAVRPSQEFDTAAANKRAEADAFLGDNKTIYSYGCALDAKRGRLYVSLWGSASVAVVDVNSGKMTARMPAGEHPCDLTLRRDGKFLFVANANDNTVSVLDTESGREVETICATLFPKSPRGATPNSLALARDDSLLFVANATINAVAVVDVATPGHSRCLGFIPTGWYPTSVRVTPDGKRLLIASGKGLLPKANPHGPQPILGSSRDEYIGKLFKGTLSIVPLPPRAKLEAQVAAWTTEVLKSSPLRPDAGVAVVWPEGNPIPARVGETSPITHCIYIVKENRTYDQVLGDLPMGNGDARLCLFPERVTPNHHKLAREFVLLDNFYVESEVSADGHEWSMAAYATDYVEKTWPMNYGHNKSGKFPYPSEGNFAISAPASGYLWDAARQAGVSYRSYGEFVHNGGDTNQPAFTHLRALRDHFDPWYRGFDLTYPDTLRAERFAAELARFEKEGDMPRLQIVRLPNDHTHGVSVGRKTPTALVADNDLGLGMVVEAVSHSKFWPTTAIFVVEDDAQNGPDHVDAHRTVALVISPYTRRNAVDSTLYSTSSMLRTMELILGLPPMTQFDAAAAPMYASFQSLQNLDPYTAVPANVDLKAVNGVAEWGAKFKFNFAKEDAADDFLLNEVIWRSVKGADQPMPAPVRAGFVMARKGEAEDQ
jgi:YVTN family beta-propeller protein